LFFFIIFKIFQKNFIADLLAPSPLKDFVFQNASGKYLLSLKNMDFGNDGVLY